MKLQITYWQHVDEDLLQSHGLAKEDLVSVLEDEDSYITDHIRELAVVVAEVIGSPNLSIIFKRRRLLGC